jgi:hypothetical protein
MARESGADETIEAGSGIEFIFLSGRAATFID